MNRRVEKKRRKRQMEALEVIGIDHGWSQMKTAHEIFTSGVDKLANEPAFYEDILEYEGSFYKIGGERLEVKDSKIENDNYYLLTLAAIAKELGHRGKQEAEVVLAVGLPITRFSDEKKDFIDYLSRKETVHFSYEQRKYRIRIRKVYAYPQCYAAVAHLIPTFGSKVLAVDVGSWTVDIMPIVNRKPDEAKCNTMNEGIIRCMNEMKKKAIRLSNGKLDEMFIQEFLMTGNTKLKDTYLQLMDAEIRDFCKRIFDYLREDGYSLDMIPIVLVGGGASIIKRFGEYDDMSIAFVEDVKANAEGFEMMARISMRKGV